MPDFIAEHNLPFTISATTNRKEALQEAQEESTSHAGRTPRQLEVLLSQNDLIDSCRPGDIVLLACYVDAVNTATADGRAGPRGLRGRALLLRERTARSKKP